MKLCYQVATPDVAIADSVTAYQGSLEQSFAALAELGYSGVELMTLDPSRLDWDQIRRQAETHGLVIPLVCTGEIFGQLGLSFANPNKQNRQEALKRVKEMIDFAEFLGANINIGRVRGHYCGELTREQSYRYAVEAFRQISEYAAGKNVQIALETVTIMQTNFINTLAEAKQVISDVGCDNFRVMMDVFHLNLEEKDICQAIDEYSDLNIHVHLADNNRRYPGHCGLDFEKIIRCFYQNGYDGAFCTEIFQIPDQQAAAEGAMRHLKPIFERVYGAGCLR